MKIVISTIAFILGFLTVYLFGAFAMASFDISTWTEGARWFIAFVGMSCAFISGVSMSEIYKSK